MTYDQIASMIAGAFGFLLTWTGMAVGATWTLSKIKQDINEKIIDESMARAKALAEAVTSRDVELDLLRKELIESQKAQDHNIGEVGLSLRRHIEGVEKKIHEIEIWNRDNYVQKPELESVRDAIKMLGTEIKEDFKERLKELKDSLQSRH
jgi:hypothetical protein